MLAVSSYGKPIAVLFLVNLKQIKEIILVE